MIEKYWYLVADIGGTNARFGVADCQTGELQSVRRYSVAEYGEFTAALKEFLKEVGSGDRNPLPAATCFAVACPPDGEILPFTNSPWVIDRRAVTELLGGNPVHIINDFAAVGYGVIDLQEGDWHQLGGGAALADRPIAVLGPGTGLGVCSVVPVGSGYGVASGEGGHVDFAPNDRQEMALLEILSEEFGHVSVERLLSGAGIVTLYQGLATLAGTQPAEYSPADITAAAVSGSDDLAVEALTTFCRILGSVAGNLALTLGAKGGVYIAGGILPRFIDFAATSGLRERFEAKGRFQSYLSQIPLRVIVKEDLGLHGAIKKLQTTES